MKDDLSGFAAREAGDPLRVKNLPSDLRDAIMQAMEGGGEVWVDGEENRKAFAQRVLEVFQRVRPESTIARQDAFGDIVIRVGAGQNVAVCEYAGEQVGMNYWGMWYSKIPFDDIEEDLNEALPRLAFGGSLNAGSYETCERAMRAATDRESGKPRTFADACQAFQDAPRTTADDIADVCDQIRDMLLEKNRKYGDSALQPVRIFSRASAVEQILVRLDDKLSRLRSAQSDEDEDVIDDLIGYLVLLKIARSR